MSRLNAHNTNGLHQGSIARERRARQRNVAVSARGEFFRNTGATGAAVGANRGLSPPCHDLLHKRQRQSYLGDKLDLWAYC
jgi:hypothetical protein